MRLSAKGLGPREHDSVHTHDAEPPEGLAQRALDAVALYGSAEAARDSQAEATGFVANR